MAADWTAAVAGAAGATSSVPGAVNGNVVARARARAGAGARFRFADVGCGFFLCGGGGCHDFFLFLFWLFRIEVS